MGTTPNPFKGQDRQKWKGLVCDPRVYSWVALLLSLACLYQRLASIGNVPQWIHSDTLWPVNLIMDLFVDRYHFEGWQFPIAPCWFPDVLLVGLAYGVLRNAVTATVFGGFLQFLLLVAGVELCWHALRLRARIAAETLTLLSAVAVTLHTAGDPNGAYGGFQQFFLPQPHVGNLVNTVWALGLALYLLAREDGRSRQTLGWAYIGLCLLATMSNVLFAVHFLFPVTIAIALLLAIGRPLGHPWLVLAGWPAGLLGFAANKFLTTTADVSLQSAFDSNSFKLALITFARGLFSQLATGDFLHLLAITWLASGAVLAFVFLARSRERQLPEDSLRIVFFVVASGASAASVAAMIFGGSATLTSYQSYSLTMRYLHPMFFTPLFAWPVAAGLSPWPERARAIRLILVLCAAASVVGSAFALVRIGSPKVPLDQYSPPLVRELDSYAALYGLKYGVAGFWHASLVTMLSRTGLRVYPFGRDLSPYHWQSNIEWYSQALDDRDRPPVFNFALLNDGFINLQEGDIAAVFGEGAKKLVADGVPVLFYPGRTQASRAHCSGGGGKEDAGALRFAGDCLEATTGLAANGVWSAHAPNDVAGLALLRPAHRLRKGRYTLEIDYSASADGDPEIAAIDIGSLNGELLYSGAMRADVSRVQAAFAVSQDARVGLRLFFTGFGGLDVRRLTLVRDSGGR